MVVEVLSDPRFFFFLDDSGVLVVPESTLAMVEGSFSVGVDRGFALLARKLGLFVGAFGKLLGSQPGLLFFRWLGIDEHPHSPDKFDFCCWNILEKTKSEWVDGAYRFHSAGIGQYRSQHLPHLFWIVALF